jgi:hypothetical protein
MTGNGMRPKLGVFVNGIPDFENLYHLLRRLKARDRVDLRVFSTTGLQRLEPRTRALFAQAQIHPVIRPNRLMKWRPWYRRALGGLDAALSLGDPLNDQSNHGHRTAHMAAIGLPTIYLQHGVIQEDVTYRKHDRAVDFRAELIFLFEALGENRAIFAPGVTDRMQVGGFFKKPSLQPKPPAAAFATELARYRQRLLFCHSFRWAGRYSGADIDAFYAMIETFARSHPDVAVIIRAHRGKRRSAYSDHDARLQSAVDNVYFSYQHFGPMKGMMMSDAIAVSDVVVSTASTALLDALYEGRPTGVYLNESEKFMGLPQVSDATSLAALSANGFSNCMQGVVARYGDVDVNIDGICDRIEEYLTQRALP